MKIKTFFDLPLRPSRRLLFGYIASHFVALLYWLNTDLGFQWQVAVVALFAYSGVGLGVRLRALSQTLRMRLDSNGFWLQRSLKGDHMEGGYVDRVEVAYLSRQLVILTCWFDGERRLFGLLPPAKLHLILLPDSIDVTPVEGGSALRPLFVAITTGRLNKCVAQ